MGSFEYNSFEIFIRFKKGEYENYRYHRQHPWYWFCHGSRVFTKRLSSCYLRMTIEESQSCSSKTCSGILSRKSGRIHL